MEFELDFAAVKFIDRSGFGVAGPRIQRLDGGCVGRLVVKECSGAWLACSLCRLGGRPLPPQAKGCG